MNNLLLFDSVKIRNGCFFFLAFMLGVFSPQAFILFAEDLDDTPIAFQVGYRCDNLTTVVQPEASHHHAPIGPIVRKQSWKDVSTYTFGVAAATYTEYNVFLRGKLIYGQTWRSQGRFELPTVDIQNQLHERVPSGNSYEGVIAAGFPIWPACCYDTVHFIPLAGFNYDRLKFRGHEKIVIPGGLLKARMHNHTTIQSPWIGLDVMGTYCRWKLYAGYEFHWARLRSNGKYTGTKSYSYAAKERAQGYTNVANLGIAYQFSTEWETGLGFQYKDFSASKGHHTTTFKTPTLTEKAKGNVKKISWNLWQLTWSLILRY